MSSKFIQNLQLSNPDFSRKRKLLCICLFCQRCVDGIQYGVIWPSAWQYLTTYGATPIYFGIVMSLSQLLGTIAAFGFGQFYNRTKRIKEILILANWLAITGNFIYALPLSPWCILIGRALTGLATGFRGVGDSELSAITTDSERMVLLSRIGFGGFIGILLGPLFALSFKKANFQTGSLRIDSNTLPAIVSGSLWIIMELMTLLLVSNITLEYFSDDAGAKNDDDWPENEPIIEDIELDEDANELLDNFDDSEIKKPLDMGRRKSKSYRIISSVKQMFSFNIMGIFATNFLIWLCVLAPETLIPLITYQDFAWGPVYISVVYMVVAVEAAFIYLVLQVFTHRLPGLICIPISIIITTIGAILWIGYQCLRQSHSYLILLFSITILFSVIPYPVFHVASKIVLAKIIPPESQDIMQSFMFSFGQCAGIIAPLWGSIMFEHLYVSNITIIVAHLLCLLWFLLSFKGIRRKLKIYEKKHLDELASYEPR